ncbi:MAG: hypothetical protein NTZ20_05485 [Candidatus Levybacteria bacterium]|nr:hypothetical protein [Candidatus Levybacteria bacterium]
MNIFNKYKYSSNFEKIDRRIFKARILKVNKASPHTGLIWDKLVVLKGIEKVKANTDFPCKLIGENMVSLDNACNIIDLYLEDNYLSLTINVFEKYLPFFHSPKNLYPALIASNHKVNWYHPRGAVVVEATFNCITVNSDTINVYDKHSLKPNNYEYL